MAVQLDERLGACRGSKHRCFLNWGESVDPPRPGCDFHSDNLLQVRNQMRSAKRYLHICLHTWLYCNQALGMRFTRLVAKLQSHIYARGWVSLAFFGKLWRARSRLYQNQNQKSFGFRKERKPRCVRETKSSPNPSRQVLCSTVLYPI